MALVALADTYCGGHHDSWFYLFAKMLIMLGHEVIAFCPKPSELMQRIEEHGQDHSRKIQAYELPGITDSRCPIAQIRQSANAFMRWKILADSIQKVSRKTGREPAFVFIAWLDSYLTVLIPPSVIDRILPYRWSGLYFHPSHLRVAQRYSKLRKGIFHPDILLSAKFCNSVAVLDEGIAGCLKSADGKRQVVIFPDLADDTPPHKNYLVAQAISKQACGRKIIGLIGSLEKRKGLLALMKLAQKTCQEDWFYVFCGKFCESDFTPEERRYIEGMIQSSSNCFFYGEYVPEESDFNALVDVCDVLFAVYEHFFHSSNILTKAALFKKPVLVQKGFCMGERVERHQLGLCVEAGSAGQCYDALKALLTGSAGLQPDYKGYLELHSHERLKAAFSSILDASYG